MNFQETLNEIAWEWATSDESQARLRLLGVDPVQWPASKTKGLLVEFIKTKSEKLRHDLLKHLGAEERSSLPDTEGEFKGLYESQLKIARARELAVKIGNNPNQVDELIHKYLSQKSLSSEFISLAEIFSDGLTDLERRVTEKKAFITLPSWENLSKGVGGFNGGRVFLLTGRTGFGKTTLALNWVLKMAETMPTVLFNMEMPSNDLASKLYQSVASDTLGNWYRGQLNFEAISKAVDEAKNKVLFSKGTALAIDQITSSVFVLSQENGPSFFMVDYDQKIRTRYGLDEWKSLQIAIEELEQVAIKTDSTIILLSQASDEGDPKASKRMLQTAATHLHFDQDEHGPFLQAKKNRFGRKDFRISVNFNPERAQVSEGDVFIEPEKRGF